MSINLSISLEDLLSTDTRHALDNLLQQAAEECGYHSHLDVAWDYWHYGRHAEHAESLGMTDLSRLFSAAWGIEHRVHGEDGESAEKAREELRAKFAPSPVAKGYTISVYGPPGDCWYCEPGDEDDEEELITTSDPDLASRFADFTEAEAVLRELVKRHPKNGFRIDALVGQPVNRLAHRSQTALDELNPNQRIAICDFRETHGRQWKSKLHAGWLVAKWPGLLQQVRNSFGPEWLDRVRESDFAPTARIIRCEEASLGVLRGLGADCGAFNHARGEVEAKVTPKVLAKLGEFPADFVVLVTENEKGFDRSRRRESSSSECEP